MINNLVEIVRLVVMISPLSVWPIMTVVLEDRRRKENRS